MIYIAIPAHDEAGTIGVLLWKVRRVMGSFGRDYQLIVLDDGSSDDTSSVLAPYTGVLPLTLLRHATRRGYAASLERLLREANTRSAHPASDAVVVLQGDFTEFPDGIPELVKRIEAGADVVSPSTIRTGQAPRAVRWSRSGLPFLLRRSGLPDNLGDPFSGFRAYRMSVIRAALVTLEGEPLLTREGWAANVELLLAVLPHARRTEAAEVAMGYHVRRRPSRFRAWVTVRQLWGLTRRAARTAP
ncbi:MAG: glycosyltransferase [Longimicrobiaceae bacterium]